MCGSSTFSFIAALGVIGAHVWFYFLNQHKIVPTVNIFGYKHENVSISDIYAACIIWITCLFLTYILAGSCQSDHRDNEIRKLKKDKAELKKKVVDLNKKYDALQKVTKRIELMVPYDLNTLVERKMWDHIPNVLYSPSGTQIPQSSRVQYADFNTNNIQKRQTIPVIPPPTRNKSVLQRNGSPPLTPRSSVKSTDTVRTSTTVRTSDLLANTDRLLNASSNNAPRESDNV